MNYKKPVLDNEAENLFCKTPGLNSPETYVLTHNRLNSYMVLIFSDLNKAQIYKTPHRDSPYHEIGIPWSFLAEFP